MSAPPWFCSAIFTQVNNLRELLFASLDEEHLPKEVYSSSKNAPIGKQTTLDYLISEIIIFYSENTPSYRFLQLSSIWAFVKHNLSQS